MVHIVRVESDLVPGWRSILGGPVMRRVTGSAWTEDAAATSVYLQVKELEQQQVSTSCVLSVRCNALVQEVDE